MARSEVLSDHGTALLPIEPVDAGDIDAALRLSDAAGWNQTAHDWRFFFDHGHVVGCRDANGLLVATAAALPWGGSVGWVSMVLVDEGWRHRGLATALLGESIEHLRAAGRVAVLDATPAGAPVYRRLGFASGFAFARWQGAGGVAASSDPAAAAVREATDDPADAKTIAALDAAAAGFDRAALLRAFRARPGTRAWFRRDGGGFVVARAGRRATQVGPLVAVDSGDAIALAAAALEAAAGPVFIDVPEHAEALAAWLAGRGFTRQRPFLRMAQQSGAPVLAADPRAFALAGPEFG
ncbi:MAG: GNAT family N-acetyltransferase [Caldimonas sp.]